MAEDSGGEVFTDSSDGNISWEAYYANQQPAQDNPPVCYLFSMRTLSLVAMIHHSMV